MGSAKKVYGVAYVTIDGNHADGENLYGYCKAHKGLLTYSIMKVHRCNCRKDDEPCMHLIKFDRKDDRYESALKGDAFRESLGKKGKNRGVRKKRSTSNAGTEVAYVPCESQDYNTSGSVEQVGDLPTVGTDLRPEREGHRNQVIKNRCSQCFWRKMFCRVVRTYVCAGNKRHMKGE